MALPIEYGTMNVGAICSGMLFFDEKRTMATWQIGLGVFSTFPVLLGIALGQSRLGASKEAAAASDCVEASPPVSEAVERKLHMELSMHSLLGAGLSQYELRRGSTIRKSLSHGHGASFAPQDMPRVAFSMRGASFQMGPSTSTKALPVSAAKSSRRVLVNEL